MMYTIDNRDNKKIIPNNNQDLQLAILLGGEPWEIFCYPIIAWEIVVTQHTNDTIIYI